MHFLVHNRCDEKKKAHSRGQAARRSPSFVATVIAVVTGPKGTAARCEGRSTTRAHGEYDTPLRPCTGELSCVVYTRSEREKEKLGRRRRDPGPDYRDMLHG